MSQKKDDHIKRCQAINAITNKRYEVIHDDDGNHTLYYRDIEVEFTFQGTDVYCSPVEVRGNITSMTKWSKRIDIGLEMIGMLFPAYSVCL
jgi:hypothetical protein